MAYKSPNSDFMIHRTATGEKVLITSMTDTHLTNTVLLLLRNAEQYQTNAGASPMSDFERGMYGMHEDQAVSAYRAGQQVAQLLAKAAPYVMVMAARRIENVDVSDLLTKFLGQQPKPLISIGTPAQAPRAMRSIDIPEPHQDIPFDDADLSL